MTQSSSSACLGVLFVLATCLPLCSAAFLTYSLFSDSACAVPLSGVPYATSVTSMKTGPAPARCFTDSALAAHGIASYNPYCVYDSESGFFISQYSAPNCDTLAANASVYTVSTTNDAVPHNASVCGLVYAINGTTGPVDNWTQLYGLYSCSAVDTTSRSSSSSSSSSTGTSSNAAAAFAVPAWLFVVWLAVCSLTL